MDALKGFIQSFIQAQVDQQEKIIKEVVEQGYKYLIMKREITYEGNTAKYNVKYLGTNSVESVEELAGCEVYDLSRAHEYLKGLKPKGN